MTKPELPRVIQDPDGRIVEFTERSWQHIMAERPQLLGGVDAILKAIAGPDHRERDPKPGRERFYRRQISDKVRWLRVVVDFSETPAFVVTAFIQRKNPTREP
jgi:hypothetical protein